MAHVRLLSFVLGFCLFVPFGIARGQDEIRYTDRAAHKDVTASGTIVEEAPGHIVYKPAAGAGTKQISAADVIDVIYELSGTLKQAYRHALGDEKRTADPNAKDDDRQKTIADAIKNYQEILSSLTSDKYKSVRRHVQYKIARLLARQADDDPSQIDTAIEALQKFKKDHSDGWQISDAVRQLARLQIAKGDAAAAQKTFQELAAIPGIPEETQQECELQAADALILAKKYPEAEAKLHTLLRASSPDSPQATRIRISLAMCAGVAGKLTEATTQLEGIIAQTTDKTLKACAYNALGDCYRLSGHPKDALWPYLWVDVIYHQDRQQHVRALEQLAKIFDDQGDKARAKQFRDRLKRETK
jgi:hypothetical protein